MAALERRTRKFMLKNADLSQRRFNVLQPQLFMFANPFPNTTTKSRKNTIAF